MLSKFVVMVAAGILASAVLGSSARAFDEPIPTKISLLKWGGNPPVGKLYKIVSSKGASFPLPAVGTGPDISGGSLLVKAGSETLSCDLSNTSLWKGLGNPAGSKGYKYVNTAAPVGDPCKLLLVKEKVIKVLAKGVGSIALPGPLGTNPDVEMVLNAGADSYCARATAPHSTEKAGALIKMKDEPAAAGCQQECGNGVREWTEQCDDGNTDPGDGCDGNCQDEETLGGPVGTGGTVTTDGEADGATLEDPLETSVTSPNTGTVSILETSTTQSPPGTFELIGQQVDIEAPAATSEDPLVLAFVIEGSQVPPGEEATDIQVFRNGTLVAPCAGMPGVAEPDPCVSGRKVVGDDIEITVLTSAASLWTFGLPGDCCALNPQTVGFKFGGSGVCGTLRNFRCSNDSSRACADDFDCVTPGACGEIVGGPPGFFLPMDLECGALYLGGGLSALQQAFAISDQAVSIAAVASCNSAGSPELTLGPTTSGQTGSNLTCTSVGCRFQAPLPMPSDSAPPTSACSVLTIAQDAAGTATCKGDVDLALPLRAAAYLNGDMFKASTPPDIAGIQPCPLCTPQCVGGANASLPCQDNTDCPAGSCDGTPNCMGGPNNGNPCAPGTLDLGDAFPTSHDCPSDPLNEITVNVGGLPFELALTTARVTENAVDQPQMSRAFCGYCRDATGEATLCFEGDADPGQVLGCPDSAQCNPSGGATLPGCGIAVPCNSDADCSAPYESCSQRDPGAFSKAAATRITLTGAPVAPGLGDAVTLVSAFCLGPTFDPTVDAAADLPGPGVLTLQAEAVLSP